MAAVCGLGGDTDVYLAGVCQNSDRRVLRVGDEVSDSVVNAAFAYLSDLQHLVRNDLLQAELFNQIGHYLVFEEPLHLKGNTGQGYDDAARVLDYERRRGAVGVFNRNGALGNVGLPLVVSSHYQAAPPKPVLDLLLEMRVEDKLSVRHLRDDLARQIVLRGADSTARDDDVRAFEGLGNHLAHAPRVVANRRLVVEVHAYLCEALRHPRRVGVHDLSQKQLGANRDYLGVCHVS